jgi:hypothetical protein
MAGHQSILLRMADFQRREDWPEFSTKEALLDNGRHLTEGIYLLCGAPNTADSITMLQTLKMLKDTLLQTT